jgi:hypothetical protein
MRLVKTVIHVHTHYSHDSNASPRDVVELAAREGVECVAITDHDEIDGARAAVGLDPRVQVIIGEEISSADGHVLGLFLKHRIEPGDSAEETIARIREQGGVALVPHPFIALCSNSVGRTTLERIAPLVDAVEICNSQNPLPWEERAVQRFCAERGVPGYVGADSHLRGYGGGGYQLLPEFAGPAAFIESLRCARLFPAHFGLGYFALMGTRHVLDEVFGIRLPGFGTHAPPPPGRGAAVHPEAAPTDSTC